MMKRISFFVLVLVVGMGSAALLLRHEPPVRFDASPSGVSQLRVPKAISLTDFQRPMDRDLIYRLRELETSKIARAVDQHFVRPFLDDVQIRTMTVDGLEVTPTQFLSLNALVMDCARVLHVEKLPRVFVVERPGLLLAVENLSDPVILVHTSILRRFKNPAELRFLIGRELGHFQAGHTRWQTLARKTQACLERADFMRTGVTRVALLPVFQWVREAEMTADNAGLVCAQDIQAAERAIVRLATGIDDFTLKEINVDGYLQQTATQSFSDFSDFALLWKEFNRPIPFGPVRIKQLREFFASADYRRLWE